MGKRYNEGSETKWVVNFDVKDSKGRVVCAIVSAGEVTVVEASEFECTLLALVTVEAGTVRYFARVQAGRDGSSYGSWQYPQYFTSVADRDAYIAQRLVASKEAAAKKVGK